MTKKQTRSTREDLDRILAAVGRALAFWRRALLVFVLAGLVAVPFSLTRPRRWKSETVVLYQEKLNAELLGGGEGGGEAARRLGARLREVLLSRASLEPIIKEVPLYPALVEKRGMVDAVDEMRQHITFRAREGDTFEISFEGSSPDEVQDVTRRLGDCIVREAASRRVEQAKAVKDFVDAESERNKLDLKTKEAALAAFLAEHPEFARIAAAEGQGGAAGPAPSTTAVGAAAPTPGDPILATLQVRAARLEAQLAARPPPAQPTAAPAPAPTRPPDSPELVAARRDLAEKLARYTEKHPDVVAARTRLRQVEVEAEAAARAAAAQAAQAAQPPSDPGARPPTEEEKEALRRELAGLHAQIAARRSAIQASASAEKPALLAENVSVTLAVEYRRLQREVADARERQRQLDDKQFKAGITASSVTNDRNIHVSVLDPAYRPTHAISRPRSMMLGAALLVCLLLALATAVISAQLDDRIHERADLERLDVLPIVGVIPRAPELPPRGGSS